MYLGYQNNKIKYYVSEPFEEPTIDKWEETEDEYAISADGTEYVLKDEEWEEEQRRKERLRLDSLTLTPADVERALYKAEDMDFSDLQTFIAQRLPQIDTKALAIEFRAKDFYRGAEANGVRLFDTIGALLGYKIPEDMDYLFEHKELPEKPEPEINSAPTEPTQEGEENPQEDNSTQTEETLENTPDSGTENEDLDNEQGE